MSTKNRVLCILENNLGKSISGNIIAEELGLSRNMIWKYIKQLQNDGYAITAATNKGYCLSNESDVISEQQIRRTLKTSFIGSSFKIFETITSTNTVAKELVNKTHGNVIISKEQTGGRGRTLGRDFYSPKNGLYMTITLTENLHLSTVSMLTAIAAVAVAGVIRDLCGLDAKIKWVNDIFIRQKKICGILSEANIHTQDMANCAVDYAIIGIGINTYEQNFPEHLANIATSLAIEGVTIQRAELIAEILNQFENYYNSLDDKTFLTPYRNFSCIIGKKIDIVNGIEKYTAVAESIDDDARLIVRMSDGSVKKLNAGEVSVRKSGVAKFD